MIQLLEASVRCSNGVMVVVSPAVLSHALKGCSNLNWTGENCVALKGSWPTGMNAAEPPVLAARRRVSPAKRKDLGQGSPKGFSQNKSSLSHLANARLEARAALLPEQCSHRWIDISRWLCRPRCSPCLSLHYPKPPFPQETGEKSVWGGPEYETSLGPHRRPALPGRGKKPRPKL